MSSRKLRKLVKRVSDDKDEPSEEDLLSLYKESELDRLNSMGEFDREKELAARYDEQVRKRQRQQLFQEHLRDSTQPDPPENKHENLSASQSSHTQSDGDLEDISEGGLSDVNAANAGDNPIEDMAFGQEFTEDYPDLMDYPKTPPIRGHMKFEKTLLALTPDLLESILVTPERLSEMHEHPLFKRYLRGCLVYLSHIASQSAKDELQQLYASVGDHHLNSGPYLSRITDVHLPMDLRESPQGITFTVIVLGTSEAMSATIADIVAQPVSSEEVEFWKLVVKSKLTRAEDILRVVHLASHKARELESFVYTEKDVDEILKRKNRAKEKTRMYISRCYQRRTELESALQTLRSRCLSAWDSEERAAFHSQIEAYEKEARELTSTINAHSASSGAVSAHDFLATPRKRQSASSLLISGGAQAAPHRFRAVSESDQSQTFTWHDPQMLVSDDGPQGLPLSLRQPTTTPSFFTKNLLISSPIELPPQQLIAALKTTLNPLEPQLRSLLSLPSSPPSTPLFGEISPAVSTEELWPQNHVLTLDDYFGLKNKPITRL